MLAAGAFLGLAVVFLYDVTLTGRAYLLRDILTFFHPWQSAVAHAWRGLHLPLWNHDTYCGIPLAANLQSGVWYPPNWLFSLLPFDFALTMTMVLHLAIAGVTMRAFLRRLPLHESSAFLGGALFGFGTWTLSHLEFPMKLGSAVWLPLLWSGVWDAMRTGSRRGLGLAGLAVALSLFAGYPQITFLGLVSAFLLAAFLAPGVAREKGLSAIHRIHRWGTLPVAVLLGAVIAGVQLFPAAEMTEISSKAAPYDAAVALTRSLPPKALLGLFDPFAFGFPGMTRYWGGELVEYCFGAFYVGGLGMILAIASAPAFRRFRRRRRLSREEVAAPPELPIVPREIAFFLLSGIVAGLLLALGHYTPLYGMLHAWLPGFDRFRWPATASYLIAVHLAALAAVGLEAIRREHAWIKRASWGAIALGLVLLVTWALARGPLTGVARGALLAGSPPYQQAAWDAAHSAWLATLPLRAAIPLVAGVLGLTLVSIRSRVPVAWTVLLLLDLFLAGRGLGFTPARGFYDAPNERAAAVAEQLAGHRLYTPRSVDQLGNFLYGCDNPAAFEWAKRAMLCNANVPAGVAQANGCDPLSPRRHDAFTQVFDDPTTPHPLRERIFDLWDAGFLLEAPGVRPLGVPEIADPDEGLRWNHHDPGIGRATLVSGWRTFDDGNSALEALLSRDHDPRTRALLEIPAGAAPPPEASRAPHGRAERVEYTLGPNSIHAAWHVGEGGLLRVLESWAPGWKATVNGKPAPVYRADFLFLAVPVPAGSVDVELNYRPDSLRRGAIATGIGLVGLALCLVRRRRAVTGGETG
jgi:Bacterial membrane protein YfhO